MPHVLTEEIGAETSDFLTPEQRIDAIAEILSTIALRIVTKGHETQDTD
jgi:hypothetical protein